MKTKAKILAGLSEEIQFQHSLIKVGTSRAAHLNYVLLQLHHDIKEYLEDKKDGKD